MKRFFAPSRKLAAHRLEHGGHRIYDPKERIVAGAFDAALRLASPLLGLTPKRPLPEPRDAGHILALRLDRLGDLITTLPALEALRASAPKASITLAVGSWNEPVARVLPFVDEVRIVDTPWASWGKKVRMREAREGLGNDAYDLAIDFQGDVRVLLLAALAGARLRAGYGDTGGSYLLTHRAPWDEKKSWYWQNAELVRTLFPGAADRLPARPYNFVQPGDRAETEGLLGEGGRPLIGVHPSAGRQIKQWEESKFAALIDRLSEKGRVVLTGSSDDRLLVERIVSRARSGPLVLLGLQLRAFAAVVERLDVFVTGDTGPMHLSHAVGTPNVAIFGPSDPVRYGPDEGLGLRRVVRRPVYCSPCNMIRRPPSECARLEAPECLARISVEDVLDAVNACCR